MTRDFHVSDLRDEIYDILELVSAKPMSEISSFLTDFKGLVEILYHQFAVHLADTGCAQPTLNSASLQRRVLTLDAISTWVPD